MTLRQFIKKRVFLDGAMGSILQNRGLQAGELPEIWNITHSADIIDIHKKYMLAGSNVIATNTFGAFSLKFHGNTGGGGDFSLQKIIHSAIHNAFVARDAYIAECKENGKEAQEIFINFDIGPTGKLLKPLGDLLFEDAVSLYKETFSLALGYNEGGQVIDGITIETMTDIYEAKAAIVAAKETLALLNSGVQNGDAVRDVPIFATMTFDASARTLTGSSPEIAVAVLEGLRVDALGVNCSLGPRALQDVIKRMVACARVPVIVKPNAGLPHDEGGRVAYDLPPLDFAEQMTEIETLGVGIMGGCCGTNDEYIRDMISSVAKVPFCAADYPLKKVRGVGDKYYIDDKSYYDYDTISKNARVARGGNDDVPIEFLGTHKKAVAASYNKIVEFGGHSPTVLIGERINPTGKKRFKEALRSNDIPYIIGEGLKQEEAGANALDVNVGLPEIDEQTMMQKVVTGLQEVCALPLQIDTTEPDVMEKAVRLYNGKAIINSVNGKKATMDAIFPIVQKYGGVVVALLLDEHGIPSTAEERFEIARKIAEEADKYNIPREDLLFDALTMTVSNNIMAANTTLEVVRMLTDAGFNTVLGVSNVSFGLPNRPLVTAQFFARAMDMGLKAAIVNVLTPEIIAAYKTRNLLAGLDTNCTDFLDWAAAIQEKGQSYCSQANPQVQNIAVSSQKDDVSSQKDGAKDDAPLFIAITKGRKSSAEEATKALLQQGISPTAIIDAHIMKALDYVGDKFEKKTLFLPQLLCASDAAKASFEVLKTAFKGGGEAKLGPIVLATVHGDIHDIGKNIVKTLLENYNFRVIDLGKDVPPEDVVKAVKESGAKLVGLSALMTTTVKSMEQTIALLRKECPGTQVCVGGAVLTQEYSDKIGADFYAKDAAKTVEWAQSHIQATPSKQK